MARGNAYGFGFGMLLSMAAGMGVGDDEMPSPVAPLRMPVGIECGTVRRYGRLVIDRSSGGLGDFDKAFAGRAMRRELMTKAARAGVSSRSKLRPDGEYDYADEDDEAGEFLRRRDRKRRNRRRGRWLEGKVRGKGNVPRM